MNRVLWRSGITVSALALGTAWIGGLGYSRFGDHETRLIPEAVCVASFLDPLGRVDATIVHRGGHLWRST